MIPNNDEKRVKNIAVETEIIQYLIKFPQLVLEPEFPLSTEDFSNKSLKLIFAEVFNRANEGAEQSLILTQLTRKINDNSEKLGSEKLQNEIDLVAVLNDDNKIDSTLDKAQFKILYEELRKYSLLRDLLKAGFSIDSVFTRDKLNGNVANFELPIEEIIKKYKDKLNDIDTKYQNNNLARGKSVSDGLRQLIEQYKLTPDVGVSLDGEIYNYACRGARLGKLYLTSSPSGGGKTRRMVGQACKLSLPYIDEAGHIILKEEYYPALFISTEQSPEEIQTLVLAYVSGVSEDKIKDGLKYATQDDLRRIEIALKIIELFKDYLLLEQIPDPSVGLIKTKMLQYIFKNNVQYIFFDYIFSSPSLLSEFQGVKIREDVILLLMSNAIKEIATMYNVFIMSATQVSGDYTKAEYRGMNFIRGSKAIADKADFGTIVVRIMKEEKDKIQNIIEATARTPNIVSDIYKNRGGSLTEVKIFSYFDYGTCRMQDMFITDLSYIPIEDYKILRQPTEFYDDFDEFQEEIISRRSKEEEVDD